MITWEPRILARDLAFPEGPVVLGEDDVVFVETTGQRLSRVRGGERSTIARLGGGPNGAAVGPDGALFVANNGGLAVGPEGYQHADEAIAGCIQRVTFDGAVSVLATGFPAKEPHRPNDIAFGPDGAAYVTDPHNWEDLANLGPGRIWRVAMDGTVALLAEVDAFCNGIGFARDGSLLVARSIGQTIERFDWTPNGIGGRTTLCSFPDGFPDGFCVAEDGSIIVCGSMGHRIAVFDEQGALRASVETGPGTEPTNCALGDGVLYVTLSGTNMLVAVPIEARTVPERP